MEDFKISCKVEFDDIELNALIVNLKSFYKKQQHCFAGICLTIYKIHSYFKERYVKAKDNLYYSCNSLLEKFGFDKKAVSRYKQSYERFCQGSEYSNIALKDYFNGYTSSKLFELLPLSYSSLEELINKGIINSEMTVKQIRKIVKQIINGDDAVLVADVPVEEREEINEEEIPMAFDPLKKYDFEYYKAKTKNQILNMVWELQNTVQKLLNKKK